MSKTIITVQHTQSIHHVQGIIGGWYDCELTEFGKEQALAIGMRLAYEVDKDFVIFTSDLKRANQTADQINKVLNLKMYKDERIREVNVGQGNGQTKQWYQENKEPVTDKYNPDYRPFPDADSDRTLWERVFSFYKEIMANEFEKIIIVSHGTALRFLRSMIIGDSFDMVQNRTFDGVAGSISNFFINDNGSVKIRYINKLVYTCPFDMKYTAVIEQTYKYQKRMKFIAETNSFIEKNSESLAFKRNFMQPYGWIKESGTPPMPHLDVIIMTDKEFELGDEAKVKIIGIFLRSDNDNKLVAVLEDRDIDDLSQLTETEKQDLNRLYKPYTEYEGWFGRKEAIKAIEDFYCK